MTYTSVDTVPAKVFFKILKTGHVNLLTDKIVVETKQNEDDGVITIDELNNIWATIQAEDEALVNDTKSDKILNISKKIDAIVAQLGCIRTSVFYLKTFPDDEDLINQLKNYGYRFTENMTTDLERIERENEGLELKYKNYKRQLDKINPKTEDNKKPTPFDEVVLGYGVVTGLTYRTNEITQSEYRALINVGNQKMKSIENTIGNKNGKR